MAVAAITAVAGFVTVVWWVLRGVPEPPTVQSMDALRAEGHTAAQAKAEQRRQRAELRAHANTKAHSVRAASQVGRFALRVGKQLFK